MRPTKSHVLAQKHRAANLHDIAMAQTGHDLLLSHRLLHLNLGVRLLQKLFFLHNLTNVSKQTNPTVRPRETRHLESVRLLRLFLLNLKAKPKCEKFMEAHYKQLVD